MHASRTDFPPAPVVSRIVGLAPIDGQEGWTITMTTDNGYRDILMFAPPVQASVSIEPQTHMPGNCSLPEGHPEGLTGLDPGATVSATAVFRLVPPTRR
jgi:galactose mutarotase-like enzyme